MTSVRRGVRLLGLPAAAIIVLSVGASAVRTQSATPVTFADLFHEYLRGDADRAVQILATWPARQIERDVKLPPGENDPWFKAALALLLSQVYVGLPETPLHRQDVSTVHMEKAITSTLHMEKAITLMGEAHGAARASSDRQLLAFCRDWYIVGLFFNLGFGTDFESETRRRFPDDPLAQLELGKRAEWWMEIVPDGGTDGWVKGSGRPSDIVGTSSHGPYGEEAAKAERAFRRALALDPTVVEARVRLGRVLWFLDRREEAERELTEAQREATGANAAPMAYLAALFLGQLYEETGRLDAAREVYEKALSVYPTGQAARLALGRLLVATGREADGWTTTALALEPPAWDRHPPDPWTFYSQASIRGTSGWSPAARFNDLRSRVRR